MFLITKDQLDDSLGWHPEEVYNKMIILLYKGKIFEQIWADYSSLTWGYEMI